MQGILESVREKTSEKGYKYWTVIISGQSYSVWDEELLRSVRPGDRVEFSFTQSGQYRKIVEIRRGSHTGLRQNPWLNQQAEKGRQIARMNCLRTAAQLIESKRLDPTRKAELALRIAAQLEQYVLGQASSSPIHRQVGT